MHTPPDPSQFRPSDDSVRAVACQAIEQYRDQPGNLLPILHAVQHALGCIPAGAVPVLAEGLQLSRAEIHGVISFYPHLRSTPAGTVLLEVCRAEACQAMGGEKLADHAQQRLGCSFHATTADGAITLEPVYCLGLCAQSPAVMINGQPHARMTAGKLDRLLQAEGV
ncbi:formate dehydrogenase subunit gamma [Pollutimonas thiosulfatoxidans]|uniref:Formate dehydrogenase subunit gamma n=1 Tax=Pollutimonas thiosulfatoxidans TaxID=2028345 RepID=A0A410G8C5_9BURK|nr:formate dehydrogenase subunit gamma [Pollutimonas thiosulfatoxidans]QAA92526.1 formate dehydrogenase subunit gamma [Pollutimonas thiosulfatoxidans]